MDDLNALEFEGIDTIYKAVQMNVKNIPDSPVLGTLNTDKNGYDWMTFKQVAEYAEMLSYGIMALNLCPEVEAEGKKYRFIGIQSKNRKEWSLTSIAGMYQSITAIAMFDGLSEDA